MKFNLRGEIEREFHVAVVGASVDNLGAHYLGGFKESFSAAYRICRKCFATKELSQVFVCSILFF